MRRKKPIAFTILAILGMILFGEFVTSVAVIFLAEFLCIYVMNGEKGVTKKRSVH